MRTLLADACPPGSTGKKNLSRPRLGFLGVGWIGRNRLEAIAASGVAEITAIADASPEMAKEVARTFPRAAVLASLDDLMEVGVEGIVIATPSALHAAQAVDALERGMAVFCQKPMGRTAEETRRVVDAARADAALFVNPDDAAALEAALQRLIAEPTLRSELSARACRVAGQFTPEKMANNYLMAYSKAAYTWRQSNDGYSAFKVAGPDQRSHRLEAFRKGVQCAS